jgi:hypothetical protein
MPNVRFLLRSSIESIRKWVSVFHLRSVAEDTLQLNHPTQFVKGALQMLSNRNKESDEPVHPTHRLEPQLLDGFVDIHNFANEYLRSQFDQELIGDLVPVVSFFSLFPTCLF